jgi:S1-C subfamily serine protease
MALIPPHFMKCVAAIGADNDRDERQWDASAFFYGYRRAEGYNPMLVTNRHVFEEIASGIAWIRVDADIGEPARPFRFVLTQADGSPRWFSHPDPTIDVAVAPIDIESMHGAGGRPMFFQGDQQARRTKEMTELGVSEGDFVYLLGFPMGLVGEQRNFVIARSGTIARIQDVLDGHANYFLLDASVFHGNSGGPVILKPEAMAIGGTRSSNVPYLIGIVQGRVPYRDKTSFTQGGQTRVSEETSRLVAVYPIDYVDQTVEANRVAIDAL